MKRLEKDGKRIALPISNADNARPNLELRCHCCPEVSFKRCWRKNRQDHALHQDSPSQLHICALRHLLLKLLPPKNRCHSALMRDAALLHNGRRACLPRALSHLLARRRAACIRPLLPAHPRVRVNVEPTKEREAKVCLHRYGCDLVKTRHAEREERVRFREVNVSLGVVQKGAAVVGPARRQVEDDGDVASRFTFVEISMKFPGQFWETPTLTC